MYLKNYIKVFDNALTFEQISSIIKWSNKVNFINAGVGEKNVLDKKIRNCQVFPLGDWEDKSKTKIHWYNYLRFLIKAYILEYQKNFKIKLDVRYVSDISILKYEEGGFYKIHHDSFFQQPREISFIILLNNDYEGGSLNFYNPSHEHLSTIEVKPGRLIMWPSNFLFQHKVETVTKGTRYSIVAWTR